MLSRVASLIYWMSRYIERADNAARILDAESTLALDHGHSNSSLWRAPLAAAGDLDAFRALYGEPTAATALQFLLYAPENPNSILSCLSMARENGRAVRETLPSELVTALNKLYWVVKEGAALGTPAAPPSELLEAVRQGSALVTGLAEAGLSRNQAWHFVKLGQMLERADQTSRLIDVKFFLMFPAAMPADAIEEARWLALLRSASALQMYRRKQGHISPREVARFLIFDHDFPRSLRYCLDAAAHSLSALAGDDDRLEAVRLLGRLRSKFVYDDEDQYLDADLHIGLDEFQVDLNAVGDAVNDAFFNPSSLSMRQAPDAAGPLEAQQQ